MSDTYRHTKDRAKDVKQRAKDSRQQSRRQALQELAEHSEHKSEDYLTSELKYPANYWHRHD